MKTFATVILMFVTTTCFSQVVDYKKLFKLDSITTNKSEYLINKLSERLKTAKFEYINIQYYELNENEGTFRWAYIFTKEHPHGLWYDMEAFEYYCVKGNKLNKK
jgi:hypothetical protein